MITVQFHADPVLYVHRPRPESEWKDKQFAVAARSLTVVRICTFAEIARWGPGAHLAPLWTNRRDEWTANSWNSVAVEEKVEIEGNDLTRMRWEIETDV